MKKSPSWEANKFSASQEIPHILWKLKVHYRIHNSPPPVPILRQIDSVHAFIPFPKINYKINLPSTPRSFNWSPSFRFPR
jgi:hypothetical protein